MTKTEMKAELSQLSKSHFIPPCGKQALFDGLREMFAMIERHYGKCMHKVKCGVTPSGLPTIQIISRPQPHAVRSRQTHEGKPR